LDIRARFGDDAAQSVVTRKSDREQKGRLMSRYHRFNVGKHEVVVLSDGASAFPSAFLMVGVEEDARLDACTRWGLDPDAVPSNMNCIYIKSSSSSTLFDTGAGATLPGCGRLPEALKQAGIEPESIDRVIHTHLHLDHLGWNTNESGDAMFPNADYLVGKTEYAFWCDPKTHDALERSELWNLPEFEPGMSAAVKSQVLALGDRVGTFPDDGQPAEGVRGIPSFGHSPGHMAFEVDLGDETLMITGDLTLSPFHIDRRDWYPAVDLDPEASIKSRERVFNYAADHEALIAGYHLPFPGLGRVKKTEQGWEWKALS
jgi:glyoxylase-like metal-dependent hydrolase (beta-lactamase superfamily II)